MADQEESMVAKIKAQNDEDYVEERRTLEGALISRCERSHIDCSLFASDFGIVECITDKNGNKKAGVNIRINVLFGESVAFTDTYHTICKKVEGIDAVLESVEKLKSSLESAKAFLEEK